MESRNFSERIQYQVVLQNLEKNDGQLKCDNCETTIKTKSECHFDHIIPYAKGGKSSFVNCQILCSKCNLRKNDKQLKEFEREHQARKFIFGDGILMPIDTPPKTQDRKAAPDYKAPSDEDIKLRIIEFVKRHGDIRKVDLSRKKNNLPLIGEINKRWGGLKQMKEVFGIKVGIQNWNRDRIKLAIENWLSTHGDILQIDLIAQNGLPSLPCILKYYPELQNFSEVKEFFGLKRTRVEWTSEGAIEAGRTFVKKYGSRLRQYHLGKKYNLPSARSLERLFGGLREYQRLVGAEVHDKNMPFTREDLNKAINEFFGAVRPRKIKNRSDFFDRFDYSIPAVSRQFGTIDAFLKEYHITEEKPKKSNFTKEEVDIAVLNYLRDGGLIPKSTELARLGLPSSSVIEKFYDSWREPFVFFSKMLEKDS